MITINDINNTTELNNTSVNDSQAVHILNFSNKSLERDIPELPADTNIFFLSEKEWSTPDLLNHILNLVGNAAVCITTYSITSLAVDQFKSILYTGNVSSCKFVLDKRVLSINPAAIESLRATGVDIEFRKCHAKLMLISNDKFKISVVSSANFHRNPRWEAGVISTSAETFQFFKSQFDLICK